jgi:DNA-binding NarL/FixJ family response regulator
MEPIKLMILDDHLIFASSVSDALAKEDDIEIVATLSDGTDIFEKIDQYCPNTILMDVRLGAIDGLALTEAIKEKHPDLKVVLMSGFLVGNYASKYGADAFFSKEDSVQSLIQILRSVFMDNVTVFLRTQSAQLTKREIEILKMIAQEKTNKTIAMELQISERTVNNHVVEIYRKLEVQSKAGAAAKAVEMGFI